MEEFMSMVSGLMVLKSEEKSTNKILAYVPRLSSTPRTEPALLIRLSSLLVSQDLKTCRHQRVNNEHAVTQAIA